MLRACPDKPGPESSDGSINLLENMGIREAIKISSCFSEPDLERSDVCQVPSAKILILDVLEKAHDAALFLLIQEAHILLLPSPQTGRKG